MVPNKTTAKKLGALPVYSIGTLYAVSWIMNDENLDLESGKTLV